MRPCCEQTVGGWFVLLPALHGAEAGIPSELACILRIRGVLCDPASPLNVRSDSLDGEERTKAFWVSHLVIVNVELIFWWFDSSE